MRKRLVPSVLTLAGVLIAGCLHRGIPSMPPPSVSYMVDTVSPEHREVLDLWRAYLASAPYNFARSDHWSQVEQERWPIFDLAGGFVYGSGEDYIRTRATVFQIAPARPRDSSEYVIRTVFTRPDPDVAGERMLILRVYATRENGRWVLSNALERMTADWKRSTFGIITYVHPADHKLDTARARMAVRFIDSVATVFDAPKPKAVTYYLARDPEEIFRIDGIEFYLPGSRAFTMVGNYMVFSGVPKYGEFFPHELTHMVLGWVLPNYGTPQVLDEAMALWLGGGREMTWPEVRRELAGELRRDSTLTLEKLMEVNPARFIHRLSAAAALLELAHQRGGVPALKAALGARDERGGPDVIGSVSEALDMRPSEVAAAWRKLVLDGG
jgi:hypothetical protein